MNALWKRVFVRENERERIVTFSALIPIAQAPGGAIRMWMDLVWLLPASEAAGDPPLADRTTYRWEPDGSRYQSLPHCIDAAMTPQPEPKP